MNMCRTYNGYDINWAESWKNALLEVAETGKLKHKILTSPRQKDGRGNISPNTIILPTLAMEAKYELGEQIPKEALLDEMINQFKADEKREPTSEEIDEMKNFLYSEEDI